MELPADIRETLSPAEFASVLAWWDSLTSEQQRGLRQTTDFDTENLPLIPDSEELDPDEEFSPYFEYMINHEVRVVSFVADAQLTSSYRIASSYTAALGSDYRHGESGTVH